MKSSSRPGDGLSDLDVTVESDSPESASISMTKDLRKTAYDTTVKH